VRFGGGQMTAILGGPGASHHSAWQLGGRFDAVAVAWVRQLLAAQEAELGLPARQSAAAGITVVHRLEPAGSTHTQDIQVAVSVQRPWEGGTHTPPAQLNSGGSRARTGYSTSLCPRLLRQQRLYQQQRIHTESSQVQRREQRHLGAQAVMDPRRHSS